MHITEIWRFPVKSMGGETLLDAEVCDLGIVGDRGWSIFDVDTGNTLTARRTPSLLFAAARVIADELVITLPDGTEVDEGGNDSVSDWLGRPVEIRSAGEHNLEEGGTYEAPLDAENDDDWVSWQGPGGAFHDSTRTRVSIVSVPTMRSWDRRRFRTNVVVDRSGEDELVGRRIVLGDARLDVLKQIDRCVMVSRPQPGLDRDLGVLTTINSERDSMLGVGAVVVESGRIALGAAVRALG